MSKIIHKIVLFIEPSGFAWCTPLKIGNLFLNGLAVDEDAAFEILKIFELEKYLGGMNLGCPPGNFLAITSRAIERYL